MKYRGVHMASFGGTSEQSDKVFPLYSIVCWNVLVFLNCPQLCKCLYSLGSHKTNKELILLLSGTYYNQINTISIRWFQTLTAYLCVFVDIRLCPPCFHLMSSIIVYRARPSLSPSRKVRIQQMLLVFIVYSLLPSALARGY